MCQQLQALTAFMCMHACTTDVGADAAEAILKLYPTPLSLFQAYEEKMLQARARGENVVGAANAMLQGTPLNPQRKLGPMASQKVFSCLFANGWDPSG